jgi:acetyl-CoA carboxylase biotin carboxyl carrier protein
MGRQSVPTEENSKAPRPFDVRTLKSLIALMTQHDLHEMELREGTRQIRLTRAGVAGAPPAVTPPAAVAAGHPPAAPAAPPSAKPSKTTIAIKSPTPGTYYKSPDPDSPPFVTVGSRVTPETVVCVIEAMKIFNEIHAECSGVITKVLVENAQPVEYGQALFEVDPSA